MNRKIRNRLWKQVDNNVWNWERNYILTLPGSFIYHQTAGKIMERLGPADFLVLGKATEYEK